MCLDSYSYSYCYFNISLILSAASVKIILGASKDQMKNIFQTYFKHVGMVCFRNVVIKLARLFTVLGFTVHCVKAIESSCCQ